jgi:acetyl-CoA C-acetyltransferase
MKHITSSNTSNQRVFIIKGRDGELAGSRTPIGSLKGLLRKVAPEKLGAHVLLNVIRRAGISNRSWVDLCVAGHCVQNYYAPNTARYVWFNEAQLNEDVEAFTVQQQCASGMLAAEEIWQRIKFRGAHMGIALGLESMSYVHLMAPGSKRFSAMNERLMKLFPKWFKVYGPLPFVGLADSGMGPLSLSKDPTALNMIATARNIAEQCGVTRADADRYAFLSQSRASAARDCGRLGREIDPFIVPGKGVLVHDEYPRATTMEALSGLKDTARSVLITAGNASGMGSGASAFALVDEQMAEKLGATPVAEVIDFETVALDPASMGLGPVKAVRKLLERLGLKLSDIDYFELNPAFGVQAVACMKLLGLPVEIVNLNGDAISLSHPLGMTGNRQMLTIAHEMTVRDIDLAVATLCVGGGLGKACLMRKFQG